MTFTDVASQRFEQSRNTPGLRPLAARLRRIFLTHQLTPALLNICRSYHLTGMLEAPRLRGAVQEVMARHEGLRTTYPVGDDGEPGMRVHAALMPQWTEHDLSALQGRALQLRLEVLAQREFVSPFDLASDAPLRITLIRTGTDEHILLVVAHHIAWDDASWPVFFSDLTTAYQDGALDGLDAVDSCEAMDEESDVEYWRAALSDPPEPLELPGPHGSVAAQSARSRSCSLRLPTTVLDKAEELATASGTTTGTVLLAAYCALLQRYTHADDFLVATPAGGRDDALTGRIGYYHNTIVLRIQPRPAQSFRQLLDQVHQRAEEGKRHQRVDLIGMVARLNPDHRYGVARFARVGFELRSAVGAGFCPPGVRCRRAGLRGRVSALPLAIVAEPDEEGATIEVEYLHEVLDDALANQLLRHFAVLLESALERPDLSLAELDLMDTRDAQWLEAVSTGEVFEVQPRTLGEVVAARAAATPTAVAVVFEGRHYSYREIDEWSNRMAHWLIGRGIGAEDRVAVLLGRSPELVVAALGIMKAGAVYLPVDPEYPPDRVGYILSDADPNHVISGALPDLSDMSRAEPTDADRVVPLRPENAAYVIYTAGVPKGVAVAHRPLVEYFTWLARDYQIDESERLLQVASPSFDVSIGEIFGILTGGGRLVIPRPGGLRDIGYLTELIQDEGITSLHVVPSLLGLFLSLPGMARWRSLRRVPIGGEALRGDLADRFNATFDAMLHNFYGPVEAIINASRYKVVGKQGPRIVPIGSPKINTQMRLLDDALKPVPVGVIGEIYIGGTHLARGYYGRPGLTAERFVADPFRPGGRLYRTGDLGRRNRDGDIEFLGLAEEQVKIRGFRIELGEVSAAIAVDPSVGQAVVIVDELADRGRSLVAYLTPAPGHEVDVDRVRLRVEAALPDYMVPAEYVVLDGIPITAHGKIDRSALRSPESGHAVVAAG